MKIFLIFLVLSNSNYAVAESVIVYGDGFSIGVKIPNGWDCSCDGKEAAKIGANAILFEKGKEWRKADSIIFLRVNSAKDDIVEKDLKADIQNYKKEHPGVQVKSFKMTHPNYKIASALFVIPKKSYEYVTYVVPNPFPKMNISSAMNVQKRQASPVEITAYREVTNSLSWLGTTTKK